MSKIIGVTVGTTINPRKMGEYIENGKSAYELAVKNGFEGTEQEWLTSLHGKDGKDGTNGKDGNPGYSPVRGTDYWTAADQAAIVTDVLNALPTWNGGSY